MQTLYLSSTKSRPTELKYGIFRNHRFERILDSQTYLSHDCKYEKIYDININSNYNLPIKDIDKIISICRDKIRFQKIRDIYQFDFPYFDNLLNYCLTNNGGNELIAIEGKIPFENFIKQELNKLGIEIVKEYSADEIQKINEKKYDSTYQQMLNIFDKSYVSKIKPFNYQQDILDNKLYNFISDKKGMSKELSYKKKFRYIKK